MLTILLLLEAPARLNDAAQHTCFLLHARGVGRVVVQSTKYRTKKSVFLDAVDDTKKKNECLSTRASGAWNRPE